jgi:hypothetical protein
MRHPRTYAAAIKDFMEREESSPVDEVERKPLCIEIAKRFGKTPQQVSLDINHAYLDSYRPLKSRYLRLLD